MGEEECRHEGSEPAVTLTFGSHFFGKECRPLMRIDGHVFFRAIQVVAHMHASEPEELVVLAGNPGHLVVLAKFGD